MKRIYKYELIIADEQKIKIPQSAHILDVQNQKEKVYIWCLVNIENELVDYTFRIIGTGNPIEDDFSGKYIGTFQLFDGDIIFHLFQIS